MSHVFGSRTRSGHGSGHQPYYTGGVPYHVGMQPTYGQAGPSQYPAYHPQQQPSPPPPQHQQHQHGHAPFPPGHGLYHQGQQHVYYQPPAPAGMYYPPPPQHVPNGYGQAPAPVPAPAPHLPPQYGLHAHGPPAVGYVQPMNAPAPQYGASAHGLQLSQFRPSGRKRALLIGINYSGKNELHGCVRDVTYMVHLLRTRFAFRDADLFVMTDRPHDIVNVNSGWPTRKGIVQAMHWLVKDARAGDSLFFHFSGHGAQVRDTSGDEDDGFDETILPMDYQSAGHIVDDEIYDMMVRNLPGGVRLTAVMDCCHSGTGMDLPYIHDGEMHLGHANHGSSGDVLQGKPQNAVHQGLHLAGGKKKNSKPQKPNPDAGEVLLFAGCRDNQVAVDTKTFAGVVTGALTYCIVQAIEKGSVRDWHGYTYRTLLHEMREKLRAAKLKQEPQFSTSHPFNLASSFII